MARHRDSEHRRRRKSALFFQMASMAAMSLAVLAALVLVIVPRLSGSYTYTVLTSSMAPAYPPGTFLVVRPVPFGELGVGDVITYQIESARPDVITHRIVAVSPNQQGERTFITKGDNNSVEDEKPVLEVQIRGKLFYAVPHAGFLATTATSSGRDVLLPFIGVGLVGYGMFTAIAGLLAWRKGGAIKAHTATNEGSDPLWAPRP